MSCEKCKYWKKENGLLKKMIEYYQEKYEPLQILDLEPLKPNFKIGKYTKKEDSVIEAPVEKILYGAPTGCGDDCCIFPYYKNGSPVKGDEVVFTDYRFDEQVAELNIKPSCNAETKLEYAGGYILVSSELIKSIRKEKGLKD